MGLNDQCFFRFGCRLLLDLVDLPSDYLARPKTAPWEAAQNVKDAGRALWGLSRSLVMGLEGGPDFAARAAVLSNKIFFTFFCRRRVRKLEKIIIHIIDVHHAYYYYNIVCDNLLIK